MYKLEGQFTNRPYDPASIGVSRYGASVFRSCHRILAEFKKTLTSMTGVALQEEF